VTAPAVKAVVMVAVTKSQDEAGATIVGPVIVAISIVASAAMHRPTAAQMAMPPASMRTPAAASMIGVYLADEGIFSDDIFTQTAERYRLCRNGCTQQEATGKEERHHAVHACSHMFAAA